jgi:hypothetical protein
LAGYKYETDVIGLRDPDKGAAQAMKEYIDARHAAGWELVTTAQFFDGNVVVWKRPKTESRRQP